MLNYYNEMKYNIKEALKYDYAEILKNAENKEDAYYQLEDIFFVDDAITGNASGSYYFNSYESRKHCYNYASDVREALEEYGYDKELEMFKTFLILVDKNYINIDTMELNKEPIYRWYIINDFESIKDLNFETLDVITRCYILPEVLMDVLNEIFS